MLPARCLRAALLLPLLLAAGCGGGDDQGEDAGATTGSGGTGSGASATASLPPERRLRAAAAALARTKGFHLSGSATDEEGDARISGDIRQDGSLSIEVEQAGTVIGLRQVAGTTFFRADRAFWEAHGGKEAASLFAGKWVTGLDDADVTADFERFTPKELAYCLTRHTGKLSDGGEVTFGGKRVTIVKGAGGQPGSSPGSVSIAADGEPVPLRLQQTGRQVPGGAPDPRCLGEGADETQREDVVLSDFGATAPIERPAGAVDLGQLQQGGSSGTKSS